MTLTTHPTVWPIVNERSGGWNKTGIALVILALFEFASRSDTVVAPSTKSSPAAEKTPTQPKSSPHWLPASLALGGLIFSLHSLLSDPTTLIAWAWTGFPLAGPVPSQHGSLTHVAQLLGLALAAFLASSTPDALTSLTHPLYLAFGAGSAYVMYAYKDWAGYAGGLGVAVFLMSIIPAVWARARDAAGAGGAGKTAAMAWLVVCLFDVASTFTVAYAFVPGGEYFRERTDL